MPYAPARPCAANNRGVRCPLRITGSESYCPEHKKQFQRERNRARDPEAVKFYKSAAWLRTRKRVLERDNHTCQQCLSQGRAVTATHVDHRQTRRERPDLELEDSNLTSLCHSCHSSKTNREDGGFGNDPTFFG